MRVRFAARASIGGVRSRLTAALVLVLLTATATSAHAVTTSERAAARALTTRTVAFDQQLRALAPLALEAGRDARTDARRCTTDWRAAPPQLKGDLGTLWFSAVSGGLWRVERRTYDRWIRGLERDRTIAQAPTLRRATDRLRDSFEAADDVYRAVPDPCSEVRAWRRAGWAANARPAALTVIARALRRTVLTPPAAPALVRRAGPQGTSERAARVLERGVDEPDARVETGGCDRVGGYLLDGYRGCGPKRSGSRLAG